MKHSILDDIEIASPCSANWDEMTGSERARFCAQCSKNVYNILDMTKQEAEALIFETEGEVCVRLFRRKDGTVITDDCPVGLRVVRACYKRVAAWITTIIGALTSVMPCIADQEKKEPDKTLPRIEIQSHSRAMGTTNFFKVTLERRILEALNA
ncbi:MAG: hypothetical protein K2Z81_00295, partial [Cyanobacteria bacterium]|nr:hypothetical protein [Cyanobacteriota bacterium]